MWQEGEGTKMRGEQRGGERRPGQEGPWCFILDFFLLYPAGAIKVYHVWEWHKEPLILEKLNWRQQGWCSFICSTNIYVGDTKQKKSTLHLVKEGRPSINKLNRRIYNISEGDKL